MAQIENLPEVSIRDLDHKEVIQRILDIRLKRRQIKERKRKPKAEPKPKVKKSPEDILKGMSDADILKVMALIRGESDGST